MFSTARKLGGLSLILTAINIVGLVMLTLFFIQQELPFQWLFTWLLYIISASAISVVLTIAIRSFIQDVEVDSSSTTLQLKKLKERIEELEKNQK